MIRPQASACSGPDSVLWEYSMALKKASPRRLAVRKQAPSFLVWEGQARPSSLSPKGMFLTKHPFLNFDFSGLFIYSFGVRIFRGKKLIISHLPWPICKCSWYFIMESPIIKAWSSKRSSKMVQLNIECSFLPQKAGFKKGAPLSIRFLYLSSHHTAL